MTDCCCQKPEQLKTVPEKCSREQIEKCHGSVKDHSCVQSEKAKRTDST